MRLRYRITPVSNLLNYYTSFPAYLQTLSKTVILRLD